MALVNVFCFESVSSLQTIWSWVFQSDVTVRRSLTWNSLTVARSQNIRPKPENWPEACPPSWFVKCVLTLRCLRKSLFVQTALKYRPWLSLKMSGPQFVKAGGSSGDAEMTETDVVSWNRDGTERRRPKSWEALDEARSSLLCSPFSFFMYIMYFYTKRGAFEAGTVWMWRDWVSLLSATPTWE